MATQPIHTRLITAAAREVLQPLGLVQSGLSRVWIDDHAWWLIGVSFEPSSFTKGTYLSVSVTWLWTQEHGFGSHCGGRIHRRRGLLRRGAQEFVKYQSEEQFAPEARRLAVLAAHHVVRYRALFPNLARVPSVLLRQRKGDPHGYAYHIAVACGLVGQGDAAREYFDRALIEKPTQVWHQENNDLIGRLRDLLHDRQAYHAEIQRLVTARRLELKLAPNRAAELPDHLSW